MLLVCIMFLFRLLKFMEEIPAEILQRAEMKGYLSNAFKQLAINAEKYALNLPKQ